MSDNVLYHMSMIMNVDQAEIAKIVHDYIERDIGCNYDRLNCPPPPIPIRPVKIKTLKERLEEMQMKATSVQKIKNVKDVSVTVENYPMEMESKLTVTATTDDDIFEFEFVGPDILQNCKKSGLFTGWEKDKKIRELEKELGEWKKEAADCLKLRDEAQKEAYKLKKENDKYKEKIKKLEHDDMLDKNAADYWSKEHDILLERFAKLQVENEKLKDKLENVEPFRSLERTIKEKQQLKEEYEDKIEDLQHKYNLERCANEAQHKFFREYAGKGTEIEFNYAIGDDDETTYVIVDREEYKALKNIQNNVKDNHVYLGSIPYSADDIKKLKERINKLEEKDLARQKAYYILDKALKDSQRNCIKWYDTYIRSRMKTMQSEQDSHEKPADNVNHPSHYTGKYECIDVMQDVFGDEATNDFCLCNAFKYIWRARKKNGLEDVKKAVWYLNKYIEEAEDGEDKVTGT